ncbi:MAG TPA: hypothetical protein VI197_11515 [Polyangiaceae bacterium]
MPVNHSGVISSVLACSLAMSVAGCSVDGSDPAPITSTKQAVHGDNSAFVRIFRPLSRESLTLAAEVTLGQDRLCQLQADIIGDGAANGLDDDDPDDGGWDFSLDTDATEHSTSPSPQNTYGSTALALLARGAANPRALGCALDAALGMQARPEVDSPPDFVFWVLLGQLLENPGFAELAAARYDAKVAAAGGAQALGESIQELRHNAGDDGLIPYDLAWLTFAALGLDTALPSDGYRADAETYAGLIASDLRSATPLFDRNDGTEAFYTDGLSWSLLALHAVDLRPGLQRALKRLLLGVQLPNGAFGFNQDFPEPDLQATAGALLALELAGTGADRRERRAAIGYLVGQQTADGGWDYAPGLESTQANADVLLALGRARETPLESGALIASSAPAARRSASRPLAFPID